jgi:hypothetical protein
MASIQNALKAYKVKGESSGDPARHVNIVVGTDLQRLNPRSPDKNFLEVLTANLENQISHRGHR